MKPTNWYWPRGAPRGTSNFDVLDVNVIAAETPIHVLPPSPDLVMGRKARSLAEVWGLKPPRAPYAGRK